MKTPIKEEYKLLSEITYNKIHDAIINGELQPGAKISETGLAGQLGVSRTPVREALRRLNAEGFVVLSPNSKFVVNEFTEKDALEVLQIRRILEGATAMYAARNINKYGERLMREQIQLSYNIETDKESFLTDSVKISKYDIDFHRSVYLIAGNSRLLKLGESLQDRQVRVVIAENWRG